MISFEFHFQPNGQQVYAHYGQTADGGFSWQTRTYVENGHFVRRENSQAVTDSQMKEILELCLAKEPERVIFYSEDCIVNVMPSGTTFRLVAFDSMSGGVFRNSSVTKEQLRAIAILTFLDEDDADAYVLAEKALDGCPNECRPIP